MNGAAADSEESKETTKTAAEDSEAHASIVSSLRSQIDDLFTQVSQLNNKLVQSYERVSDLEDDLHVASSNIRSSSVKISQLELERTQHLSALNTGLLVEKSHVTAELTRLMEKATEEAAQRGQAESARADIEKDLDDLSASLFGQANTMVAEARYERALSERKVEEAEQALKGAEEAVGLMQTQMQALHADKELAEKKAYELQSSMGKGKWAEHSPSRRGPDLVRSMRLLSSHLPYQEFTLFIAHLRSVHNAANFPPPSISTLLPLPFLARIMAEDSDPTVRLDLAPSLNWLSRRTVLAAIHSGQLIIEPMSSLTLLHESASYTSTTSAIPGLNSSSNNISCALCGTPIFAAPDMHSHSRPPAHPLSGLSPRNSGSNSWSNSLFKNPLSYGSNTPSRTNSPPTTPVMRQSMLFAPNTDPMPNQVHIFRVSALQTTSVPVPNAPTAVASTSSFAASAQPHYSPSSQIGQQQQKPSTIYPLCANGWCLTRLRATCSLWAFIRTGIVDKVWEEESAASHHHLSNAPRVPPKSSSRNSVIPNGTSSPEKPPVPPRRRGLWGMASALGERASSWTESDKDRKEKEKTVLPPVSLAAPKPQHVVVSAVKTATPTPAASPPPLPRRSETRGRVATPVLSNSVVPAVAKVVSEPEPSEPAGSAKPDDVLFSVPHDDTLAHTVPLPESRAETPVEKESSAEAAKDVSTETSEEKPATEESSTEKPATEELTNNESSEEKPATEQVSTDKESSTDKTEAPVVPATVPPPLPRRAAARAPRPLPNDAVSSRPSTPVAVSKEQDQTKPEMETKTETETETKLETEAKPESEIKSEAEPAPERTETVDVPLVDSTADAEAHADEQLKTEMAELDRRASNPAPNLTEFLNESLHDEPKTEQLKMEESEPHAYIGDETWEERTWKDLAKLREDMFWARIGGHR